MTTLVLKSPRKAARRLAYLEARAINPRVSREERARAREETDRLVEQLRTAGRCRRCGAVLTDPDSVERGVGPVCVRAGV